MKDLYTFDETQDLALKTYQEVRAAYAALFDELKIPYLVAEADSGSMGGNLSHEYHFPTSKGEDHIISCGNCSYVANEELAEGNVIAIQTTTPMSLNNISFSETAALPSGISQWVGVSRDRLTLVRAFYPSHSHSSDSPSTSQKNEINIHAIKATFNALESGVEDPLQLWKASFNTTNPDETATLKSSRILNLIDCRLVEGDGKRPQPLPLPSGLGSIGSQGIPTEVVMSSPTTGRPLNLLRIQDGDICPKCSSKHLKVQKAVELGHTFFLGTRYSRPLRASVATAQASSTEPRPNVPESKLLDVLERDGEAENSGKAFLQMGCHGIGVSRMIAAVADSLADDKGLNWPTVIAPFEVVIIPKTGLFEEAERLCDRLTGYEHTISRSDSSVALGATGGLEVVMDDRQRDFVWKLQDADLVGYPIIVVLGKAWEKHRRYEVQCRRLGLKKVEVPADALTAYIRSLLEQM
ncbi:MAG: hypothetical protein M1819_000105 [Sarea resinae]|nr:MAG: hypothetical protein M1819_000105 [Sarea resinae]